MTEEQITIIEEAAFYESGLSADGCLEKLDSYAREAIKKYGRYLTNNLEQQLQEIEEYGTEEINAAVDLRSKLAEALVENEELKKLARKLYGTVLHVYALAKEDPLVLVGPMLYKEAAEGAKEYEIYNGEHKN
jgi:hypothetical protein